MTEKTAEEWAASMPESFPLWLLRDVIASAMAAAEAKGKREMAERVANQLDRWALTWRQEWEDTPVKILIRASTEIRAFALKEPTSKDELAKGPNPLERLQRPASGERCPRCHNTAPNLSGCALCDPETLSAAKED